MVDRPLCLERPGLRACGAQGGDEGVRDGGDVFELGGPFRAIGLDELVRVGAFVCVREGFAGEGGDMKSCGEAG